MRDIIASARQTANPRRRNMAYEQLTSDVKGHTRYLTQKWSDFLDDAEIHDAQTDAMIATIRRFDRTRRSAFSSLYFSILSNKLVDANRRKNAKSRGLASTSTLSSLKTDALEARPADIAQKMDNREMFRRLKMILTPYQFRIIELYLSKHTYRQIADVTNREFRRAVGTKRIDNELHGVKKKLKSLLKPPGREE